MTYGDERKKKCSLLLRILQAPNWKEQWKPKAGTVVYKSIKLYGMTGQKNLKTIGHNVMSKTQS